MPAKKMDECCGCCTSVCSACGWGLLVWGALLIVSGLGYFPQQLNGWVILGLGIGVFGLMSALKIAKH